MPISPSLDSYWASLPPTQLIPHLEQKVSDYDRHIDQIGRWISWRDLYYSYYLVNETNYIYPTYGADGFKRLNINHFRAMLKHLLSLVTAQRVTPQPIATNSDYKSQSQVDFCRNILRYVNKEKQLDDQFELATEMALVMGAAYVGLEWDATLGEPYAMDPMTGQTKTKGDFVSSVYNPIDCIFDFASSSWTECGWVILRKYVNRWDLVAKFPTYADQIRAMSTGPEVKRHRLGHIVNEANDDLIPLYTFYHKKTSAIPRGRMTYFLDADTCLFDGELPYKRVPVHRICADKQLNSAFPYTVAMDLLPVQKVYNALCSAVCTNQAAFGVQNILVPRECAISLTQLTEGLNAIYYDPMASQGAKPEPLNLLLTAPEVFKWIEYLEQKMAQISGVNETIQGNPEANLKSGTALAFVAAQALTFISPLSRSYNSLLEETWTGIVDILKGFATVPRLLLISGLNNRAEAKEFTNQDIADVDRVIVEAGNPLADTTAGRIQMAQDLLQGGLINKEEYMTVFQTGQLEPLYEYEKAELLCMKSENEALQNGQPVMAMVTDNHPLHVREHLTLMSSPDARMAPNNPVMTNVMAHVQQHLQMWQNMDPKIGAILNVPPPPQPPAPPGPKVSESISFKDLPPQGQMQMAKQAGIDLTQGQTPMAPGMPGQAPQPGNPGMPPPPSHPLPNSNPTGTKHAGAPNLPQLASNPAKNSVAQHPPMPGMPSLPAGTDSVTAASAAQLPNSVPHQPPLQR